jgi:hypothetical protein
MQRTASSHEKTTMQYSSVVFQQDFLSGINYCYFVIDLMKQLGMRLSRPEIPSIVYIGGGTLSDTRRHACPALIDAHDP